MTLALLTSLYLLNAQAFFLCNTSLACFECLWQKRSHDTCVISKHRLKVLIQGVEIPTWEMLPTKPFPQSQEGPYFTVGIQAKDTSGVINILMSRVSQEVCSDNSKTDHKSTHLKCDFPSVLLERSGRVFYPFSVSQMLNIIGTS